MPRVWACSVRKDARFVRGRRPRAWMAGKNSRTLRELPRWEGHEEKLPQVVISRGKELGSGALELDSAIVQHHEARAFGRVISGPNDLHAIGAADRFVLRDIERVANLVRHGNRGHVLQVAELHNLIVDRRRGD